MNSISGMFLLSLKKTLLQLLLHRIQNILTNSHLKRSQETELSTTDLKLSNIMMEMVTLTAKTMEDGSMKLLLLKEKLLHSPLLKTLYILMSFHSRNTPEIEFITIDLKHSNIMTEMVMKTANMMEDGKFHLLFKEKQLHLPPHKTQNTPTSFLSRRSQ
jgi:hypothetical protein